MSLWKEETVCGTETSLGRELWGPCVTLTLSLSPSHLSRLAVKGFSDVGNRDMLNNYSTSGPAWGGP